VLHSFDLTFSFEDAKDFYPKDDAWRVKYGQKRIDFLLKEKESLYLGSKDPSVVGRQILDQMAYYLSSGPCKVVLFACKGGAEFGRALVGATVPKDALPETLRGMFGEGDSLESSAQESRGLRNVVHAPEPKDIFTELASLQRMSSLPMQDSQALQYALVHYQPVAP
jgi:nucleoside diphosphate kinase